jgi:hypothetical protein
MAIRGVCMHVDVLKMDQRSGIHNLSVGGEGTANEKRLNTNYIWSSGLPDFSCYMIPKPEKMYQMNTKSTKW